MSGGPTSTAAFGAAGWWDQKGTHALLHMINPARLEYVAEVAGPLAGKRVADIGCGGGIFAEALARAGAAVVGIDRAEGPIDAATRHAAAESLPIDYRVADSAQLAASEPSAFDIVVCMEMLEHVDDPAAQLREMAALLRLGGDLVVGTVNRNPVAYLAMIAMLEKILGILPHGTHSYEAFIRPDELAEHARAAGLQVADVAGLNLNPLTRAFVRSQVVMPVNYLLHATRSGS